MPFTPEEVQRRLEPRFGIETTQAVLIYAWQNGSFEMGKSWAFFYQLARWHNLTQHRVEQRRRRAHTAAPGPRYDEPGQEARVAVRELLESMPASVHDAYMTRGSIKRGKRFRIVRWKKRLSKGE